MNQHDAHNPTTPDASMPDALTPYEVAALYVCGGLDDRELARFEAMLLAGEPEHVRAMNEVRPALEAIAMDAPSEAPPASARAALMARLGVEIAAPSSAHAHHDPDADHDHDDAGANDPLVIVRRQQIDWRPTGLPGVRGKTLFADRKNNRRTLLLNMAPGSRIPDHDHGGIEEVLVLEGDLSIGDERLNAGDYFRATPGCRHGEPRTTKGCIALVFSTYSSITTRTKIGFAIDTLRTLLRGGKNRSA